MMFSTASNYVGNYVGNLKLKFGRFGFWDRYLECVIKSALISAMPGAPRSRPFLRALTWDHGKVECHSFSQARAEANAVRINLWGEAKMRIPTPTA
jgi:hypothetical protein